MNTTAYRRASEVHRSALSQQVKSSFHADQSHRAITACSASRSTPDQTFVLTAAATFGLLIATAQHLILSATT